ncbi:DUF3710 domain-containing protein [Dermatophilus congolensis]|uniref:DUF3710 domain-containing protein n=1 Tax=Dermatophilus congolensis TaxID=1863 RepID=UPI001AAFADE7|nr:DUF3710 domain-containing protein [Dermatophilus congolensis]MBO3142979.1 DUF3710 domain-containing protein [Dermatophilus congolensis]MBO3151968.1 DUF3710 domain-containing protein [Dermatophilus congolensis]MBO3161024.1 DUF3710 domain-containing protein [Dermatophilus congolensis]MBO3163252.1 DUF3710 domain-containing protein [Dermatophilus congolensis]MBO3176809.1 DUF3710 domain-containing protein [Dermatophilus congolensis]
MGLFGRKRSKVESVPQHDAAVDEGAHWQEEPGAGVPVLGQHTAEQLGPFDSGDVVRPEGFLDFGSVWLPNIPGVTYMVETDQQSNEVTGMRLQIEESVLQLQVFAAPKSKFLWGDIREEIATSLRNGGGEADITEGPYGAELMAAVPTPSGLMPMRFIGVDGPRWFLRGVISGPAASDPDAGQAFIDLLRVVVVHRGRQPMAPRELLPMHMPRDIGEHDNGEQAPTLDPFERGPEITEIR